MEPTEELKMLISQLVTADLLIQRAQAILEQCSRSQTASSDPVKPSMTTDHAIYQFLRENNGRATKREELFDVFGWNEEAKRIVMEKLQAMQRFGLVAIQGDLIALRKAKP